MDMNCKVIEDILKFFEKNDISSESEELINKHIAHCLECAEKYQNAGKGKEMQEKSFIRITKKIQRSKKRTALIFILSTAVICVLALNFILALRIDKPLFVKLWKTTESSGGSSFTRSYSLGFVVDKYDIVHSKFYSRIKPLFAPSDSQIALSTAEYQRLMDQLSKLQTRDTGYNEYFDVKWFSSAQIYEITEAEDGVNIYMFLSTKAYLSHGGFSYIVGESENPIKVTAKIANDTITIIDVWYPVDLSTAGLDHFLEVKKAFPSYLYNDVLRTKMRINYVIDGLTLETKNNVLDYFNTPVSPNSFEMNTSTGWVYITARDEGIDRNGEHYSRSTGIISKEQIKKMETK